MKLRSLTVLPIAGLACAAHPVVVEPRIQRPQTALSPPVPVRGETPAMKSLADRMAELKVPGVSIAVIDEGRIDWARGFGVRASAARPSSPETLFQAASISKPVFALARSAARRRRQTRHRRERQRLPHDPGSFRKTNSRDERPLRCADCSSHSAGTTVHGFPGYGGTPRFRRRCRSSTATPPANTGTDSRRICFRARQFRYSGGGYTVAQLALIDVTRSSHSRNDSRSRARSARDEHAVPTSSRCRRRGSLKPPCRTMRRQTRSAARICIRKWPPRVSGRTPSDLARYAIGVQRAFAGESKTRSDPRAHRARHARSRVRKSWHRARDRWTPGAQDTSCTAVRTRLPLLSVRVYRRPWRRDHDEQRQRRRASRAKSSARSRTSIGGRISRRLNACPRSSNPNCWIDLSAPGFSTTASLSSFEAVAIDCSYRFRGNPVIRDLPFIRSRILLVHGRYRHELQRYRARPSSLQRNFASAVSSAPVRAPTKRARNP